jgi:hypothetical protein
VFTIIKSHRAKHSRAQGMVEFALALPVFLLLMLGIIEFARLLVTYSAVYTASREAVRYGVATGMNTNLANTPLPGLRWHPQCRNEPGAHWWGAGG